MTTSLDLDSLDPELAEQVRAQLAERQAKIVVGDDGIADFSKKRPNPKFRVDDDLFEGARALPAGVALEFVELADRWQGTDSKDALGLLSQLFELVLLPESHTRFTARLHDKDNPIDIDQVGDIIIFLLEKYGFSPTEPSSSSSPGSENPDDGKNSTGDVLSGVST